MTTKHRITVFSVAALAIIWLAVACTAPKATGPEPGWPQLPKKINPGAVGGGWGTPLTR
jgi:hypothetical protein